MAVEKVIDEARKLVNYNVHLNITRHNGMIRFFREFVIFYKEIKASRLSRKEVIDICNIPHVKKTDVNHVGRYLESYLVPSNIDMIACGEWIKYDSNELNIFMEDYPGVLEEAKKELANFIEKETMDGN